MPRIALPLGQGLDRYTGVMAVEAGSMADLRNVRPLAGKLQARRGALRRSVLPPIAGAGGCIAVPLVHAIQSQQEGVAVGYYAATRQVHVYRIGGSGVDPQHIAHWFTLPQGAAEPPYFSAAESYGKAFLAHDEIRESRRATTQVYDALNGTLTELTADLGSGSVPIKFRGVESWRNYLVGWGFGTGTEVRPEIVRVSLPGQPESFQPEHYFIAGDRGSPVTAVRPAGSGLVALKPSESYQIVGTSHLDFGILPLYTLFGAVGTRLAITVEGTCYAWGIEGPWATTISTSGDLEPPIDLERPGPPDLPVPSDARDAFAVYVPRDRVIEWHWGSRIYALSVDPAEGVKWSYRQRGFAAAGGGLLYTRGDQLADGAGTAPTGHAEITSVAATGVTGTLRWMNKRQDGDEALETWLKKEGGEWAQIPPDIQVTLEAMQSRQISDLEFGSTYTVAVRYRRDGLYAATYAHNTPDNWPASARKEFAVSAAAPVLNSAAWERLSATVERVRLSFTPAAGHEAGEHKIYRDGGAVGVVPAGETVFDDLTVTGETNHTYRVAATQRGQDGLPSNALRVWTGPAPPANATYSDTELLLPDCREGTVGYTVQWSNADPRAVVQVRADGGSETSVPAGRTSHVLCADDAFPSIQLRHRLATFGVVDASEWVSARSSE